MPRDLFGNVTRPSVSIGNRKWYTVPLSLLSHSIVVGVVVVVPLMATDVLPAPWQPMTLEIMPVAALPTPPPPPKFDNRPKPPVDNAISIVAPDGFTPEPPMPDSVEETTSQGPGVIDGGLFNKDVVLAPPPAPEKVAVKPVAVGGNIRRPQKINDVQPIYPPMAQAARVQGIVIIEATLGADGRVMNTRVLRSIPLLDNAAVDAVRQWEFTPTLLNGVPVPVVMTVTVSFVLGR